MKTISIQDLKNSLSSAIDEAASGETLIITKHGRPIARLEAADSPHVTVGERFGHARLESALSTKRRIPILESLNDDRSDDESR